MNTEVHLIVRLLYSLCLSMIIWGCFTVRPFPGLLVLLGAQLLGVVLGRLLEPRTGPWLRQRGDPYRLQLAVMATFTACNVTTGLLKQPVIGALLAAAMITLLLGDDPGRTLKRRAAALTARLRRFSRPVMPALPPGGTG